MGGPEPCAVGIAGGPFFVDRDHWVGPSYSPHDVSDQSQSDDLSSRFVSGGAGPAGHGLIGADPNPARRHEVEPHVLGIPLEPIANALEPYVVMEDSATDEGAEPVLRDR